jgi:hypothetical protein
MDQSEANFSMDQLEYFQQIQRRNTWLARAMLLGVLMSMLFVQMWMTQRNYESMLINVDQTRLAQVNLFEAQVELIRKLEVRVVALQQSVAQQQAQQHRTMVSTAN